MSVRVEERSLELTQRNCRREFISEVHATDFDDLDKATTHLSDFTFSETWFSGYKKELFVKKGLCRNAFLNIVRQWQAQPVSGQYKHFRSCPDGLRCSHCRCVAAAAEVICWTDSKSFGKYESFKTCEYRAQVLRYQNSPFKHCKQGWTVGIKKKQSKVVWNTDCQV